MKMGVVAGCAGTREQGGGRRHTRSRDFVVGVRARPFHAMALNDLCTSGGTSRECVVEIQDPISKIQELPLIR